MFIKKCVAWLSSVKLTVFSLFGVMILVFLGTIEQVDTGVFVAQEKYFRSLFVYWQPKNVSLKIPYFPGGYFFVGLLFINITSAYVYRFRINRQKLGILMIHLGLGLLILSEIVTALFAIESQIAIKIGDMINYSESLREFELVVIDTSNPEYDQVVSVPEKMLRSGKLITHPHLPFTIETKIKHPNSRLLMLQENEDRPFFLANRGFGAKVRVVSVPPIKQDDKLNLVSVFVELKGKDQSLGTWLLSNAIPMPQSFNYLGKHYEIALRRKRYYFPFSLKLTEFVHEVYPGTKIPKNFSSTVNLYTAGGTFDRQTRIYMNHPFRFDGKTFYQASYGENDTLSVFQVVENPGILMPYLSSGLVSVGLLVQFVFSFYNFKIKKMR